MCHSPTLIPPIYRFAMISHIYQSLNWIHTDKHYGLCRCCHPVPLESTFISGRILIWRVDAGIRFGPVAPMQDMDGGCCCSEEEKKRRGLSSVSIEKIKSSTDSIPAMIREYCQDAQERHPILNLKHLPVISGSGSTVLITQPDYGCYRPG
jgi:hypothetical protein